MTSTELSKQPLPKQAASSAGPSGSQPPPAQPLPPASDATDAPVTARPPMTQPDARPQATNQVQLTKQSTQKKVKYLPPAQNREYKILHTKMRVTVRHAGKVPGRTIDFNVGSIVVPPSSSTMSGNGHRYVSLNELVASLIRSLLAYQGLRVEDFPHLGALVAASSSATALPATVVYLLPSWLSRERLERALPVDAEIMTEPRLAVRLSFTTIAPFLPQEFHELSAIEKRARLPGMLRAMANTILRGIFGASSS